MGQGRETGKCTMSEACFVGMDISQDTVDMAVHPGTAFQIANDEPEVAEAVKQLQAVQPTLIVPEATGALKCRWRERSRPPPTCRRGQSPRSAGLCAGDGAVGEDGSAGCPDPRPLQKRMQAHITWLEHELQGLTTDLTTTLRQSPTRREKEEVLRSVLGVGPVLTTTLLANLSELGTLTCKEVAALAGVAPFPRDSGTLKGRRATWSGRAHVRAALYTAALVTTRRTPVIRAFYERLCQAGKAKKLVLTARMRKLLTILNAMVKSGTPWHREIEPANVEA